MKTVKIYKRPNGRLLYEAEPDARVPFIDTRVSFKRIRQSLRGQYLIAWPGDYLGAQGKLVLTVHLR